MQQAINLDALSVALHHPVVAADQQNICRLRQVCKSWRTTVHQTPASITAVEFNVKYSAQQPDAVESLERTSRFCRWLYKHAGMVRSISISIKNPISPDEHQEDLNRLLEAYLQAAAQSAAAPDTPAANSAMAVADAGTTPQRLLLQDFSSLNFITNPGVLSVLPAATLTSLHYTTPQTFSEPMGEAFTMALQQLSNLKRMIITSRQGLAADYLVSLKPLSSLTSLKLESLGRRGAQHLRSLPEGLCRLDLSCMTDRGSGVQLDLAHLTNLQQLSVLAASGCQLEAGSHLPQNVQDVQLVMKRFSLSSLGAVNFTQLQRLNISTDVSAAELLCLAKLPKLRDVSLRYGHHPIDNVLQAAAVWPQLPIKQLVIGDPVISVQKVNALFQRLSSLTLLTRLRIIVYVKMGEGDNQDQGLAYGDVINSERTVYLYQSLKNLKNLENLLCSVIFDDVDVILGQGDLLHVSSLTGLTYLYLICGWRVHHVDLLAILSQLRELRHLDLWWKGCNLRSTLEAASPVFKSLTNLTRFDRFGRDMF